MAGDSIPRCILIVFLIIAGGFFAGTETAYSYCNKIRIKTLAENGDKRAQRAILVFNNFDKALVTLLTGNNIIHIAASSIATVMAISLMGKSGSVVSTVALTLLIFIFSETIPKNIAKANSDSFALAVSAPMRLLIIVFTPITAVFTIITKVLKFFIIKLFGGKAKTPTITGDEFQAIVETIEDEGILEPQEGRIIRSAIEFSDISVKNVMLPREDIVALDIDYNDEKIREIVLNEKYSRIPVYRGDIHNIIGVIRSKDCLLRLKSNKPIQLEKLITKPYIVSPDMPIDLLFEDMCRFRSHLAVVAEKGRTLGVVTMEDILEEIVGEIYDEDEAQASCCEEGFDISAPTSASAHAKGGVQ